MSRKKKLYLFVTFVVLCICFSLFGCRKMIQNKQNNEMSNEYSQNQADTSQDKKMVMFKYHYKIRKGKIK